MTNQESFEKRLDELLSLYVMRDVKHTVHPLLSQLLTKAHAAGRREALAEVLPVIEFYAGISQWVGSGKYDCARIQKDDLSPVQPTPYTGALEPEDPYFCGGKRARALLKKLKNE